MTHKDKSNRMALHALEMIADGESGVRPDIIAKVALGRLPLGAMLSLEYKVDPGEDARPFDNASRGRQALMNPQHFAAYSAAWAYREAVHEALSILRPHIATLKSAGIADAYDILADTDESQSYNIDVMNLRNHG